MFNDVGDRIWEKSIEAFIFFEIYNFSKKLRFRSSLRNLLLIKPKVYVKMN